MRADRDLAVEYLKAAMESLDGPENRAAGLLALRTVAEAYGGLGAVAAEAGISRESLCRTLSPKGIQPLKRCWLFSRRLGCDFRWSRKITLTLRRSRFKGQGRLR